ALGPWKRDTQASETELRAERQREGFRKRRSGAYTLIDRRNEPQHRSVNCAAGGPGHPHPDPHARLRPLQGQRVSLPQGAPCLISNTCGRAEIYLIGIYAKTPRINVDDPGCIAVLLTRVMLYPCNLTLWQQARQAGASSHRWSRTSHTGQCFLGFRSCPGPRCKSWENTR